MFNSFGCLLRPENQQNITVGGRHLWQMQAKIVDVYIGSIPPDVEVFQGVGRSSMQVLKNRRTGRSMQMIIDFFGTHYDTIRNKAAFEALFLQPTPVVLNLQDGYYYDTVLTKVDERNGIPGVCMTVCYTFAATKRGEWVVQKANADWSEQARIYSPSTYPKSDCIIRVRGDGSLGGNVYGWVLTANDLEYRSPDPLTGDLEINGVDKMIKMGGKNITGTVEWADFPYIAPGWNTFQLVVDGLPQNLGLEIEYAPVYL